MSQYQKIGEAEVGVQTDFVMSCKDVAIQKDEGKSKCDCHDMLMDKVTNLENKIEQLVLRKLHSRISQQKIGRSRGLHVETQSTVLYANSDSNQHYIYCKSLIFYYVHIVLNIYTILHVFKKLFLLVLSKLNLL